MDQPRPTLSELVKEWLKLDYNQTTCDEVEDLWRKDDKEELEKRMRPRIEFGTAGLRGKMEAGWARMNDLIIIQASQGLCEYAIKHVSNATSRGVVIGHDHRHNSERWAQLTASVFIARGMKAYLFHGLVHTPMVPFGVKKLNAACGVMITASHNPKQDNGYKVYWENGVQIIGPHDKGISDSIKANLEPRTQWSGTDISSSPLCIDRTQAMYEAYFSSLTNLRRSRPLNQAAPLLRFVNTSMHGVSDRFVEEAFRLFGFSPYIPVQEQRIPDPDFPTVRFPNPEEKGALDLAIATADKEGALYVLAQDPDSDRFSAAEKGKVTVFQPFAMSQLTGTCCRLDGQWITFTGDQLGTLFASRVLAAYKDTGKDIQKLAMVASTVSSKMVGSMADIEGFKFVECLTGFKYIGNTALDLVKEGFDVPFGYEEAIGFMFGSEIRDKDGVAATVSFVELAVELHSEGKTVNSHLQELYEKYGYFKTSNGYFICNEPKTIDEIFFRIRHYQKSDEESYPTEIAGLTLTRIVDLTTGYDSGNPPTYKPSLPLSSGHMIQFRAEKDGKSIVLTTRTSGTEPKIKFYLEGAGKDAVEVSALLSKVVAELGEKWLEAGKHGLAQS